MSGKEKLLSVEKRHLIPRVFIHFVRHGETDDYTIEYKPSGADTPDPIALTDSGVHEATMTALALMKKIERSDTVLLLHSETQRTTLTAHIIKNVLQHRGQPITNPKIYTPLEKRKGQVVLDSISDLNEVGKFDANVFALLLRFVSGGDIPDMYNSEGTDPLIKEVWNPKELNPQEYYRNMAWMDPQIDRKHWDILPDTVRDTMNAIEPYQQVEARLKSVIEKVVKMYAIKQTIDAHSTKNKNDDEITSGDLHVVFVTHDAFTMALAEILTDNEIGCFNTGAAVSMELHVDPSELEKVENNSPISDPKITLLDQETVSLFATGFIGLTSENGDPIVLEKRQKGGNIIASLTQREKEISSGEIQVYYQNELSDEDRDILWEILNEDIAQSYLAATNLGIFTPGSEIKERNLQPKWLTLTKNGKTAIAHVYKGYRYYFSGDPVLVKEMVIDLAKRDIYDHLYLPDSCTFVAPRSVITYPPGFKTAEKKMKHGDTVEAINNYERRYLLSPRKGEYLTVDDILKPDLDGKIDFTALTIRKLTVQDIEKVQQALSVDLAFADFLTADEYVSEIAFYADRLKGNLPYMGLFNSKGSIIGIAGTLGLVSDKGIAAIGDVFISHALRKKGFGSAITYKLLCLLVEENNLTSICADIRYDKEERRLFEKMGFQEITHDKRYLDADADREDYIDYVNAVYRYSNGKDMSDNLKRKKRNFTPGNDLIQITQLERKK